MNKLTLREYLNYLLGEELVQECQNNPEHWVKYLSWPPNAFAVSAKILEESGHYIRLVSPSNQKDLNIIEEYVNSEEIISESDSWIYEININQYSVVINNLSDINNVEFIEYFLNGTSVPNNTRGIICRFFSETNIERELDDLGDSGAFIDLIKILAVADETCAGLGVNLPSKPESKNFQNFLLLGDLILESQERRSISTFCPTRLSVLPKMRVPQTGISVNSLSHNLACINGETTVYWNKFDWPTKNDSYWNILIFPYPHNISTEQFSISKRIPHKTTRSSYFKYKPDVKMKELIIRLEACIENALKSCGRVDFIVFPEATFTTKQYYRFLKRLKPICLTNKIKPFVVAGVINTVRDTSIFTSKNTSVLTPWNVLDGVCSFKEEPNITNLGYEQVKHHRWQLDATQIATYGLTKRLDLDSGNVAWEAMAIEDRRITFNQISDKFSLCTLVCEDLARQEPVAKTLRSVGPNLVMALLLDGPQIGSRWPGRYATSLTEEPGSSVLTVTALGMTQLSLPKVPNFVAIPSVQRTVALWKDQSKGTRELNLQEGAHGIILTLESVQTREVSADGRCCGGEAVVLQYSNHHSV